jgi:hypothetical protein
VKIARLFDFNILAAVTQQIFQLKHCLLPVFPVTPGSLINESESLTKLLFSYVIIKLIISGPAALTGNLFGT